MDSDNNQDSNKSNIIYSYTAEQAVDDGILHDVSKMAGEAGFTTQVRITSGVLEIVIPDENAQKYGQSYEGRLWDVLSLARLAIKQSTQNSTFVSFEVVFQDGTGKKKKVVFWAAIDTTSGFAIHIMLPEEY